MLDFSGKVHKKVKGQGTKDFKDIDIMFNRGVEIEVKIAGVCDITIFTLKGTKPEGFIFKDGVCSDVIKDRNAFSFPSEGDDIGILLNRRREKPKNLASNKFLGLVREELVKDEGGNFFIFKENFRNMHGIIHVIKDTANYFFFSHGALSIIYFLTKREQSVYVYYWD